MFPGRADVQIGPFLWPQAPVGVMDEKSAKGSSLNSAGNIGAGFLRNFRLTVDLGGPRMWLAQEFPFRRLEAGTFGVGLANHKGKLLVWTLAVEGPAAKAGLQKGDEITAINGLAVKIAGRFAADGIDQPAPGERLQVAFERNGKPAKAELVAVPLP